MLTTLERRQAERDQDLARREVARKRRLLQTLDLSPVAKEQLAADIDDLEQECAMLGTLLAENGRTGWTMARFASEHDSPEERPYQEVAR